MKRKETNEKDENNRRKKHRGEIYYREAMRRGVRYLGFLTGAAEESSVAEGRNSSLSCFFLAAVGLS